MHPSGSADRAAGGAGASGWRRPLMIIGGLVASFTVFTLAAASILSALGLAGGPAAQHRDRAAVRARGVAAFKAVRVRAERPFAFMTRRRHGDPAGGFLLGLSLGLVFVPCAGPVLATITVLAAKSQVSIETSC